MKKLHKLQIIPEKLMKNDELLSLKGGYDPCTCHCFQKYTYEDYGYLLSEYGWCQIDCSIVFGPYATGHCEN